MLLKTYTRNIPQVTENVEENVITNVYYFTYFPLLSNRL